MQTHANKYKHRLLEAASHTPSKMRKTCWALQVNKEKIISDVL